MHLFLEVTLLEYFKCPDLHSVGISLTQEKKHFSTKRQCFEACLPSSWNGMMKLILSLRLFEQDGSGETRAGHPCHVAEGSVEAQLCGRAGLS